MKKKALIILLCIATQASIATATTRSDSDKTTGQKNQHSDISTEHTTSMLSLPNNKGDKIPMLRIIQKGDYSIYRCSASETNCITGCHPTGIRYHYFVYKGNRFHMTVTKCNQANVFDYFTN